MSADQTVTGQLEHLATVVANRLEAQWHAQVGCCPDWRGYGCPNQPGYEWTVDQVLAALLDGAEVREEWGCRLTWDNGDIEDTWLDERKYAQLRFDLHQQHRADNPGWRVTPTLIRRLHLTLAAEAVGPESTPTESAAPIAAVDKYTEGSGR